MQLPSHEDIADHRIAQFKQTISAAIESQELGLLQEVIESYQQEHNADLTEIAAALAYLVQKDRPLTPAFTSEPAAYEKPAPRSQRRRPTGPMRINHGAMKERSRPPVNANKPHRDESHAPRPPGGYAQTSSR